MLRTLASLAVLAAIVSSSPALAQATAFCPGDGTLAPGCPCMNIGSTGRGCENSVGSRGARLYADGTTSPDTLVFTVTGELPTSLSIVFQSDAQGAPTSFGDGLQCLSGTVRKLYVKHAVGGTVIAPESGDPSITQRSATLGDPIPTGAFRYYHVQYRDRAPSFCPAPVGSTWNVSTAMMVQW